MSSNIPPSTPRSAVDQAMAKAMADLGWSQLVEGLAARCHTDRGAAVARALVPEATAAPARERIAQVSEARLLHQLGGPPPFGGISDVEALVARTEKAGALDGQELVRVAEAVAGCAALRRHLAARRAEAPKLWAIVEATQELSHVSGPILDSFEQGGEGGGRLADHASPALGPLRKRLASLHDELGKRVRGLLDDPQIAPYLQDRFYTQREDRYVVPLRSDARARVKGIVHGTSQSGQTVFVEPEGIVELNNKLKLAESEVTEEEQRILAELSGFVREEAPAIRAGLAAATRLDVLDGAARLADALGCSAPELGDLDTADGTGDAGGALSLKQARHPHMLLAGRDCVPNDIEIAAGGTLVVSGPNAGGKTVALKTAGLLSLMARAGLHVPADPGSRLPCYRAVLTDIGDEQSLDRNLSTFSAHLMNLRAFLDVAGVGTLVLIDELCVGTEPEQGAAFAEVVLLAFAERGAQAIVTTHYERLKALAPRDPRFVNASVGFDLARMAPTFRLHLGVPGSSGALFLARRLGLPTELVGRAEALLGDRRTGIEELLTALAEERRRLDEERKAVATVRREADVAVREAEAARRAADAREKQLRKGAYDEVVAELAAARNEIDRLRTTLKRAAKNPTAAAEGLALAADAKGKLAAIGEKVAAHAPAAPALPGRPASAAELVVGTDVLVASLNARGTIVAAPDDKGRVTVQIGTLRTTVSVEDVRVGAGTGKGAARKETRAATSAERAAAARAGGPRPAPPVGGGVRTHDPVDSGDDLAPPRSIDNTLDLRGERVDDALDQVDRFVDDALLAEREVVFVIHGHGTGALKAAVRAHLGAHRAVAKWRTGKVSEGGDGITLVWLDA